MAEFRDIIIPGEILEDGVFSIVDFQDIFVEIPKEFAAAAWGYGRYYGRYYGRGL
jgi:hypothetical protein